MSKTPSQYTTTKSLKAAGNSRKNLLRLALILITIMLGLLFASQLFNFHRDVAMLTSKQKIEATERPDYRGEPCSISMGVKWEV